MEKNEIRKKIRDLKSMLLEKERQSAADDVFRRVENTAASVSYTHLTLPTTF